MQGVTEAFEALLESVHFFGGWFIGWAMLVLILRSVKGRWNVGG